MLALLAAACTTDDDPRTSSGDEVLAGEASTTTTRRDGGDRTASNPAASATTCAIVDDYERAADATTYPVVFELSAEELAEQLEIQRDALVRLRSAEDLPGGSAASLDDVIAAQPTVDAAIVAAFREHRTSLEVLGLGWRRIFFDRDSVTEEERAAFREAAAARWPMTWATVACRAPNQLRLPPDDLGPTVEGGTIVYDPFTEPAGHPLRAISTDGRRRGTVPIPSGWDSISEPRVAADGRTVVARVTRGDPEPATGVAVGTLHDGFEVVYSEPGLDLGCVRPGRDGSVVASRYAGELRRYDHVRIRAGTAEALPVGVRHAWCLDEAGDGIWYLSHATRELPGGERVFRQDLGQAVAMQLFDPGRCGHLLSGPSPDGREALMMLTCGNWRDSGLYRLDGRSGRAVQVFEGRAGLGGWSPGGDWIAFNTQAQDPPHAPFQVYLVRRDGSGLRKLVQADSAYPAWVSDELPG